MTATLDHKVHDRLPSGFTYANELQSEAYAATGSVNGASKVCLVKAAGERIRSEADLLQAGGPDEYPRGYYEHLATERTANLAVRLRPPRTMGDVHSIGRESTDDVADYIRQYNAGWMAGQRGSGMDRADTTHAWDDGYLDAAAGRAKWHLTWCTNHDQCGEG